MKIYRRSSDGLEVQDNQDRDIDWVQKAFGGTDWSLVSLPIVDPNIKIRNQIQNDLADIDRKSIRALRTNDTVRLAMLEDQARDLRAKLTELN